MVDLATSIEVRKAPRGRPFRSEPTDRDKVLEIIRLRDEEKMRFRVIGETLGMTTQGSSQLYNKWKKWAEEYRKMEAA
jgi:hypothetical protein